VGSRAQIEVAAKWPCSILSPHKCARLSSRQSLEREARDASGEEGSADVRFAPKAHIVARMGSRSRRELLAFMREDSKFAQFRRSKEHIPGIDLFHQGRCQLAVEMRIAPGLIVVGAEDRKARLSLLDGKPRNRTGFVIH